MSLFLDRAAGDANHGLQAWQADARARCPVEAAEVDRIGLELQRLAKDAPTSQAVDLYEQLLRARDALHAAWTTHHLEHP